MTYAEKLRDPRWQRKRLEILQANNFKCQECGDGTSELHVHHVYYEKGKSPWDYENHLLKCLCANCHREHESNRLTLMVIFGRASLIAQRDFIDSCNAFRASNKGNVSRPLSVFCTEIVNLASRNLNSTVL